MNNMEEKLDMTSLLTSPFVSGFMSVARAGDLSDADPLRREAAWAHWAIANMRPTTSPTGRSYAALFLPGKFYDPKNKSQDLSPHLELTNYTLERSDFSFPTRIAQMGNGLSFPWWTLQEVTAVRRALFNHESGDLSALSQALNNRRLSLIKAVESASTLLEPAWSDIESKIIAGDETFTKIACGDFDEKAIADLFSPAQQFGLSLTFEPKLLESNGRWASRRVGVWVLKTSTTSIGVVTPRLTRNSLFKDPLFSPSKESPAALLVRALLLRRIAAAQMGKKITGAALPSQTSATPGGPYLRAVPARPGSKMPQPSVEAVMRFLKAYPDPDDAWLVLNRWANGSSILTVSADVFKSAHANALRYIRRNEPPARSDLDSILPLAWEQGESPRVVRVTFARPSSDS